MADQNNSSESKLYVVLNVISPSGLENQMVRITKLSEPKYDKWQGEGPGGPSIRVIESFDWIENPGKPKYQYIVRGLSLMRNKTPVKRKSTPVLSIVHTDPWNKYVHESHRIEIQIWRADTKIDSIMLDPTKNLPVKDFIRYLSSSEYLSEYPTKMLVIQENKYGLLGLKFYKDQKTNNGLYIIHGIFVTDNDIDKFETHNDGLWFCDSKSVN